MDLQKISKLRDALVSDNNGNLQKNLYHEFKKRNGGISTYMMGDCLRIEGTLYDNKKINKDLRYESFNDDLLHLCMDILEADEVNKK